MIFNDSWFYPASIVSLFDRVVIWPMDNFGLDFDKMKTINELGLIIVIVFQMSSLLDNSHFQNRIRTRQCTIYP